MPSSSVSSGPASLFDTVLSTEIGFWVVLASGLPDRYKIPFVLGFAGFSIIGMGVLAYKLRTNDTTSGGERNVNSKLERTDLLEGGDPENVLEWIIAVLRRRNSYIVIIGTTLGLGILLGVMGYSGGLAGALVFASVLFGLHGFLRFGWPYLEAFYDRRQPDERDPNSLRFQGLSTDAMVFLTLFAITVFGMLILVAVQSFVS